MEERVRIHFTIRPELLDEFDRFVGPRKRNQTLLRLIEDYVRRTEPLDLGGRTIGKKAPGRRPAGGDRQK